MSDSYITTADGRRAAVLGRGNLTLELPTGHSKNIRTLEKVLFVPTMLKILLSCHRLATDNGVETCTGQDFLTIQLRDKASIRVGEWDKHVELYRFTGKIVEPSSGKHANAQYVQEGLVRDVPNTVETCSPCAAGKSHRLPKALTTTQTTSPGDVIHSDVMGPFEVSSRSGANYVCTLIDDFSGYTFLGLLKRKSDVEPYVRTQITWLNNQSSGTRVKVLRSDNGGEYVNKNLDSFFKDLGITHQTSAPYTPQQNGLAERKNRTLAQDTVTLLHEAGLSKKF